MLWMYVVHILLVPDGVHVSIGEKRVEKKKKKTHHNKPNRLWRVCSCGHARVRRRVGRYQPMSRGLSTILRRH